MPTLTAGAVAIAVAQIASVLVLVAVLYGCYLQYRKPYLLHWTYGWAALICFQVATQANFFLALQLDLPPVHPLRLLAGTVGSVAGFLNIAWLFFGVYELAKRRPVRLAQQKGILIAAGVFGVVMAMLVLIPEIRPEYRYALRVSTRGVVGAIVFAFAGQALWRERRRREGVGFTILSLAFFAYAAELLHYATLGVNWMVSGSIASYTAYIGYLDLVLLALMSVGMVASLLEDEREAADLAAQQVEHLAYHDALTGLPNRPLFGDRLIMALAQAHRMQHKLAVLFLDLDRFKDINDSLGHSVGDVLLKAVAARIRGCIREGDTVARFGGDEFTLLIPRIEQVEDAAKIAQKIIETLKIPFDVHERELFATTSIGVSIYPTDGEDADTLVRNADTAMYRAKDQGRDNYQLYAPAMNAHALEQLSLENTLRRAVTQNELVLYYQPVIDLKTLRVAALEALVRWNHPEMGLLLPAHFISVAERSGVIVPLGEWVLQNACSQIRAWKRLSPVIVSVNLSARQFQQPDLVQMIRRAIEDHRIDPQLLQIEITESNAMQHADNTMHILRELKSLGIRIAMDDFGTGYSSLSYLKRFPIDTLKLDASFVQDIATEETDAAIVCAVIAMAHSLRIDVVAEGVETGDQLDVLARNGCDLIQGYLFSRPLPADQVEAYLTSEIRANGSPAMPIRPGSEAPL